MKKFCILLAAIILLITPAIGHAADTVSFTIDNENVYDGMTSSYKEGYKPTVAKNPVTGEVAATIVLPLITDDEIKDNIITATPGLGEASSSPFVYSNYEISVKLADNTVTGKTDPIPSYLVRFDLPLISGRVNGVYPVTIEIKAEGADGSAIQQTFTTYVTIKDGKKPPSESTPAPEKPSSQPKIIVSSYSINPSPVEAGGEFTAIVTLANTSTKKSVQNMLVTVSCDSPNFSLLNDSDTFYIGKLSKNSTKDIELSFKTDLETPAQRYNITLAIEYDNSAAQTLSSSGTVPVTVKQPLRVEIEAPKIPQQVNAGDTLPLSFQVMNMGRSKIYNVRCQLSGDGLIPSETAFIGNMEAGTAAEGKMDVFIGTKDMTEGYEGEEKYGFTTGTVTLTYEDEAGQQYTEDLTFNTIINPPVIIPTSAEPDEKPETVSQWWISLVIGAAAVAVLAAVLIVRRKKEKQHEDI